MPSPRIPYLFILPLVILALSKIPIISISSRLTLLSKHLSPLIPLRPSSSSPIMPYERELHIAQLAVQRATLLTQRVFHEKSKCTLSKRRQIPRHNRRLWRPSTNHPRHQEQLPQRRDRRRRRSQLPTRKQTPLRPQLTWGQSPSHSPPY